MDDTVSVDAVITALYDCISGPAGERDWDRMRSLFRPGARMIPTDLPTGQVGPVVMDVEEFITGAKPHLSQQAFYETEIARRTEHFGPMAHAFSTYESRRTPDGEPYIRGINSIQLVHTEGRWWVLTMLWANELPGQPIPAEHLPS